jgi:hypothetical protein
MSEYGVGAIAEAIVTGLCSGDDAPDLILSPRSAETASRLAERYATVEVAADNQAVLDATPVVLLSVRPQVARDVLGALRFRADQVVVSLIAGISIDELRGGERDRRRALRLPAHDRGVARSARRRPRRRAALHRRGVRRARPDPRARSRSRAPRSLSRHGRGHQRAFLRTLTEAGVYDDVRAGLDRVLTHLHTL